MTGAVPTCRERHPDDRQVTIVATMAAFTTGTTVSELPLSAARAIDVVVDAIFRNVKSICRSSAPGTPDF